ncbi:MAG TPA: DNA mismatch repair protein MutS [Planctomycetota bacterium]|nr:DNA mismatch repair protein MutS [Planctomycetota bacterium]
MMKQFLQLKERHKDCILLFRAGDFYETFYEDAEIASRVLGIALTSRDRDSAKPVPMAGVPYHAVDPYIRKLIKAGHRVAICEQMEDASEAKGLIERDVTRVITPGTLTDDSLLESKTSNYLVAVYPETGLIGLAWVDLSSGRFVAADVPADQAPDELARIAPAECILPESLHVAGGELVARLRHVLQVSTTPRPDHTFERRTAMKALLDHFRVLNLAGFGCDDLGPALHAAGAVIDYLRETQKTSLDHIAKLEKLEGGRYVLLNETTQRNLELVETMRTRERRGSLLWVLDRTVTAMGARMLREWISYPLRIMSEIASRQQAVAELHGNPDLRERLRSALDGVFDLERINARVTTGRAFPRDLVSLQQSAAALPHVREALADCACPMLADIRDGLDTLDDLRDMIGAAIVDDPPATIREGGMIRDGWNPELDDLRCIRRDGRSWIARYQADETARTGIDLKVGFNKVFGYYIEITHAKAGEKVPDNYIRRQTLKNAERYVTPELKEYEEKVLNAEERGQEIEYRLFCEVRDSIAKHSARVQAAASAVARLDVLASLAQVAAESHYVLPVVDDSHDLQIVDGRHPVLEAAEQGEPFVPNDVLMDSGENCLLVITGPNMAGKSTYIRQVALLTLMAHIGSFIPARSAKVGLVDRIFTRVGASDELSRGQSTFMVEMSETANILNNASDRSLIVLDEIGRGTSTFDGVSIAWAVAEHIYEKLRARTLFATHYHELTELSLVLSGVKNYNIAVREWQDEIIFLRKILPGGTDKSYGIHVARLAGIPREIIDRARDILVRLEAETLDFDDKPKFAPPKVKAKKPHQMQLALFGSPHEATIDEIKRLAVENMTPIEALMKLQEIRDKIVKKERGG